VSWLLVRSAGAFRRCLKNALYAQWCMSGDRWMHRMKPVSPDRWIAGPISFDPVADGEPWRPRS